jgi:hypothetical protein
VRYSYSAQIAAPTASDSWALRVGFAGALSGVLALAAVAHFLEKRIHSPDPDRRGK